MTDATNEEKEPVTSQQDEEDEELQIIRQQNRVMELWNEIYQ